MCGGRQTKNTGQRSVFPQSNGQKKETKSEKDKRKTILLTGRVRKEKFKS